MRLWPRLLAAFAALAAVILAAWAYARRETLGRQWMSYKVGKAADFTEARKAIQWFETGEDRDARLRELVGKWGGGNVQFDYFLARYVGSAECSEALRKHFSLGLAWQEGLLPRWAHYWCWRAPQEPDRQVEEILAYTDTLDAAKEPLTEVPWREILDLQAIFYLSGQPKWAERLTPANWRDCYRQWRQSRPARPLEIRKPAKPLPDWEGPIPE
jgi:hypothetical protein